MLAAARDLAPRLRAAFRLIAAERRLPDELFHAMAETGVFKAHLPTQLGGHAATLSDLAPVIEEFARADGSAGWLAYVGSEALRQTRLLSPEVAAHVAVSRYAFIAGMFTPGKSRAVAVPGGYRVTGHWHTCSGSLHADWMIGGTTLFDGDKQRLKPDGTPLTRLNFIPMSEVQVIDTWHVGGLKGTNSNDLQVEDVFVPEEYGAYEVEPPDLGLHLMVPLGIARAAIEEFVRLSAVKGPTKAGGTLYRDLPAVQREVAVAEAALRAARCYALASLAEVDARGAAGVATSTAERDAFLMASHHAAHVAVEVVDTLHRAAGTSAIYESSHLLRCFQDVHVAIAHVSLQPFNLEAVGRRLMSP